MQKMKCLLTAVSRGYSTLCINARLMQRTYAVHAIERTKRVAADVKRLYHFMHTGKK